MISDTGMKATINYLPLVKGLKGSFNFQRDSRILR